MEDSAHPVTKPSVFAGKRNEGGENAGFGIGEGRERRAYGHTLQRPCRGVLAEEGREERQEHTERLSRADPCLGRPGPTRRAQPPLPALDGRAQLNRTQLPVAAPPRARPADCTRTPRPGSLGPTANRHAPRARQLNRQPSGASLQQVHGVHVYSGVYVGVRLAGAEELGEGRGQVGAQGRLHDDVVAVGVA